MGMAPVIVSFATPEYEGEIDAFVRSCRDFKCEQYVERMASLGSWRKNCGVKPVFLLRCLERFHRPVVWSDIDARIVGPLGLFHALHDDYDLALFFIPNERMRPRDIPGGPLTGRDGLASGTLWVNDTHEGRGLLEAWIRIDSGQHAYEQIVLGEAWYDHAPSGLRTFRLPQKFCKVFDHPWYPGQEGPVIIEHLQASRRLRSLVSRERRF